MDIRWFGQSFFEVTADTSVKKGVKLFIDPYGAHIGLNPPENLEADVVLVTHDHAGHNNLRAFKNPGVVIDTPGEYSVQDVDVKGILTYHDDKLGEERGINIVYTLDIEGIRVVHLGDLGHLPSEEQIHKIDGVDILMIPIGGIYSIAAKEAVKVIKQLEPKVVIPMHYKIPGLKPEMGDLETFCKEMGICATEPIGKLSLKAGNLEEKEMGVVILEPQRN